MKNSSGVFLDINDRFGALSNGEKRMMNNKNKFMPPAVDDFDELTSRIFTLIKINGKITRKDQGQDWCCINDLLQSRLTLIQKEILVDKIHEIGFSETKDAFWLLNKTCEDMLCEPEDLVGIFKRRIFSHKDPQTDQEKIHLIGNYINLTLIQFNMLKNNNRFPLSGQFDDAKSRIAATLLPLFKIIIDICTQFDSITAKPLDQ